MTYVYPDDGHIYVCVRVRDAGTLPPGIVVCPSPGRASAREAINFAQRICVSTIENVVVIHDPRHIDNASFVARDADGVVRFITTCSSSSSSAKDRRLARAFLAPTASASCFECDSCLNSMDTKSMLRMPLVCNSDFIRPPERCTQEDVFRSTAAHAVKAAVEGINSCVFAYGQTGSGKTYTLFGDATCIQRDSGVVPRTIDELFQQLEAIKAESQTDPQNEYSYRVQFSFFEIYHNEVYCLLSRKGPLRVTFMGERTCKETMVIHNLRQQFVTSAENSYPLVALGLRRRQTGETGMNVRSSRGHAILQICVRQWRTNRITKESVELAARITLVDLAGSERQKKAKTDGKSQEEGIQINKSLATLARVINEISRGAKHVGYRDSLLTMVLKDNLGGNSKTFMIATISPIAFCYQESCATLQYAKNVRRVRNRPVINKSFQTRSNLLELNALLKKENGSLRSRINELLSNSVTNTNKEMGANITGVPFGLQKVTGVVQGCGTAVTKGDGGTTATSVVLETLIAISGATAVPLVAASFRKYTSVDGIGTLCALGSHISVVSLDLSIVKFFIADMLHNTFKITPGAQLQSSTNEDYGAIEFEQVSERSLEYHYWVRYIPPSGGDARLNSSIECLVNGHTLSSGDRRQLAHGDVICISLDGIYHNLEQMLLSFHYMDTNYLARRGGAVIQNTEGGEEENLIPDGKKTGLQSEDVMERLLREKARLKDMLEAKERTIEYQCQRAVESRSRVASLASCNHWGNNGSRSPSPVIPSNSAKVGEFATTPLQAAAAAQAFYRLTVSPSFHLDDIKNSQEFDDCSYRPCATARSFAERNSTMEELMRRLAELEKSVSLERNIPLLALSKVSDHSFKHSVSTNSLVTEVSESESNVSAETGICVQEAFDHAAGEASENVTKAVAGKGEWCVPTADELLLQHRKDPDLQQVGNMHLYMATSDGVCERYKAALRERVLCERIWYLEHSLENFQSEVQLLESKLRVANDAIMERELFYGQLSDEVAELSKSLLEARNENSVLLNDINSLEIFIGDTERALAETTSINEAEIQKRVDHMSREINELKDLATMWKRRAMNHVFFGSTANNVGKIADDVDDDDDDGDGDGADCYYNREGAVAAGSGPGDVQWNGVQDESNSLLSSKLRGEGKRIDGAFNVLGNSVDAFAYDTAIGKVPTKLDDNKTSYLTIDRKTYDTLIQDHKDLVERLRSEDEQVEIKKKVKKTKLAVDEKVKEARNLKVLYEEKCKELATVEKKYAEVSAKLLAERKKTTNSKFSVKRNSQLIAEQQRAIEEHLKECQSLSDALRLKNEELSVAVNFMRDCFVGGGADGFKSDEEIRDRIETLIADSLTNCKESSRFSVFPQDFEFREDVIALIRLYLRMMLDRLKVELYVLNRQSLHKFSLLVSAVQLRPDVQFNFFMHELRSVVAEIAGKPQLIGAKWLIEEGDVLSGLVDHRRRRIGNALNGLLIWYDHWDLSPKTEHVSYVELIRNTESITQLARLVRQESLVNTNATSSLRHMLSLKTGSIEAFETPKSGKDTTVAESRRILDKLAAERMSSNLARVVGSGKFTPRSSVFRRSQTTTSAVFCSRRGETDASHTTRANAALTRATTLRSKFSTDKGKCEGDDNKFVRRTTSFVMPVTDSDVAAAASTALARHDSTFNFDRQLTAVNMAEAEHPRTTRFARSRTDVSHINTARRELVPRRFTNALAAAGNGIERTARRKTLTASTTSTKSVLCSSRVSPLTRTNTCAPVPQLMTTRVSGRRLSSATQQQKQQLKRLSGSDNVSFFSLPMPVAAPGGSFYDQRILNKLRQQSGSRSNEVVVGQKLKKLASGRAVPMSAKSTCSHPVVFPRAAGACGCSPVPSFSETRWTGETTATATTPQGTVRKRAQETPIVPKLCFDSLPKQPALN